MRFIRNWILSQRGSLPSIHVILSPRMSLVESLFWLTSWPSVNLPVSYRALTFSRMPSPISAPTKPSTTQMPCLFMHGTMHSMASFCGDKLLCPLGVAVLSDISCPALTSILSAFVFAMSACSELCSSRHFSGASSSPGGGACSGFCAVGCGLSASLQMSLCFFQSCFWCSLLQ